MFTSTPRLLQMCRISWQHSIPTLLSFSSAPHVDVCMPVCLCGLWVFAILPKITTPPHIDLLVTLSWSRSESQRVTRGSSSYLEGRMPESISSVASGHRIISSFLFAAPPLLVWCISVGSHTSSKFVCFFRWPAMYNTIVRCPSRYTEGKWANDDVAQATSILPKVTIQLRYPIIIW